MFDAVDLPHRGSEYIGDKLFLSDAIGLLLKQQILSICYSDVIGQINFQNTEE